MGALPPTFRQRLESLLREHLSELNTRVVSERARRFLRDPEHPRVDEWPRVREALGGAARLFLTTAQVERILRELEPGVAIVGPAPREIAILVEDDVRVARLAARELAHELGATSLFTQKLATAASELARNIVSYARGGGVLSLSLLVGPPRTIRLVARDRGPGIPHLDEVLSGRYRSSTGLGKGLLGVRRLMDAFDVQTGPSGTRVTTEVILR